MGVSLEIPNQINDEEVHLTLFCLQYAEDIEYQDQFDQIFVINDEAFLRGGNQYVKTHRGSVGFLAEKGSNHLEGYPHPSLPSFHYFG